MNAKRPDRATFHCPWWFRPHLFIFCFIIPVYLTICLYGGSRYVRQFLTLDYVMLGLVWLVVLGVAAYVGAKITHGHPSGRRIVVPLWLLDILAGLTIVAYLIWFRELMSSPELFIQIVLGHSANVRGEVSTIPGLTTLSQAGVAYALLYGCYRWLWRKRLSRRHSVFLGIIILLTLFRTVAWSERLALLELVVPLILLYISAHRSSSRVVRGVIACGPYAGVLALLFFFGIAEFFRSWAAQFQNQAESFTAFVLDRFISYYYTSLNNGAGLLSQYPWPELKGQFLFGWLYSFPLVGPHIREIVGVGDAPDLFLLVNADPEFNTFSGVFPFFYDVGLVGAFLGSILFGLLLGYGYRHFRMRSGLGLFFYPVLFVALAEVLRIVYLGTSRVFPIVVLVIISYVITHRENRATA